MTRDMRYNSNLRSRARTTDSKWGDIESGGERWPRRRRNEAIARDVLECPRGRFELRIENHYPR